MIALVGQKATEGGPIAGANEGLYIPRGPLVEAAVRFDPSTLRQHLSIAGKVKFTMPKTTETKSKLKKGRSPGYPGVDLGRALELAEKAYRSARQHPVDPEAVFGVWGIKPKSSQALVAIAALKKFGLLESMPRQGPSSGKVRVTDLALNIVQDEREDSSERADLIRQAALRPSIHDELWKHFSGDLPENQTLRFHLLRERGFTESGANDFISQFQRTIAFAGLSPGGVQSEENGDKVEFLEGAPMTPQPSANPITPATTRSSGGMREVPIPIPGSAWPLLKAGFPLTEEAWGQMIEVLTAMKPGLVQPKQDS